MRGELEYQSRTRYHCEDDEPSANSNESFVRILVRL